ncbi:MAG: lysophospholipid acyltransferase family protein [Ignavibacteria bacterium]|nr:lysophospholipid acyltransferase family protein [Ignavibacteria bacterium]
MIKAKHNIPARAIYNKSVSLLLKHEFNRFVLLNEFPGRESSRGLIVTPNHFSWWDGFFAEYLMKRFTKRIPYVMMLERQLKKYRFFRYAGAFSIEPTSPASVLESLGYSKEILNSKDNYLIFYPQGEIQFYETDHVSLKNGLEHLSRKSEFDVLIVSFKIFYNESKKPSVCCRFGERFSSEQLKSDYESYKRSFIENIRLTDSDLFYKKGIDLFTL